MITGSILNHQTCQTEVWGAGIAFKNDTIPKTHKILAVRGFLTAKKLKNRQKYKFGGVVGDPALLMPHYYKPNIAKTHKLGIIPHYIDAGLVCNKLNQNWMRKNNSKVIDICLAPEQFIDELLSCETVISSSLHGIILAHAYGIPVKWVKFSNNIGGDDFKFHDHYSVTTEKNIQFLDFRESIDHTLLAKFISSKPSPTGLKIDPLKLLEVCPFKK
jgi:hypothetical protein